MTKEKLAKMQFIITESAKKYGDNKVKFGFPTRPKLSTGSIFYDFLLGGGFEKGTMAMYYGQKSAGKTTMALRNVAAAQKRGEVCAWLRIEKGCNREYMERLDVDVDKLIIIENMPYGEAYLDVMLDMIIEEVDLIVVDSISALVPKREMESQLEKELPGLQAKLMAKMLRKANAENISSTIIFISQVRMDFNTMGYTKFLFSGGKAAEHNTDYIVEFKLKDKLTDDGKEVGSKTLKDASRKEEITGVNMLMYIEKCRRGLAHRVGEMYFSFKSGKIDEEGELITVAVKLGVIARSGNWFKITDEESAKFNLTKTAFYYKMLKEEMKLNHDIYNFYLKKVRKVWEKEI